MGELIQLEDSLDLGYTQSDSKLFDTSVWKNPGSHMTGHCGTPPAIASKRVLSSRTRTPSPRQRVPVAGPIARRLAIHVRGSNHPAVCRARADWAQLTALPAMQWSSYSIVRCRSLQSNRHDHPKRLTRWLVRSLAHVLVTSLQAVLCAVLEDSPYRTQTCGP